MQTDFVSHFTFPFFISNSFLLPFHFPLQSTYSSPTYSFSLVLTPFTDPLRRTFQVGNYLSLSHLFSLLSLISLFLLSPFKSLSCLFLYYVFVDLLRSISFFFSLPPLSLSFPQPSNLPSLRTLLS